MQKITEYIRFVLALPPQVTLQKAVAKACRKLAEVRTRRRDRHRPTYGKNTIQGHMHSYLSRLDPDPSHPSGEDLKIAAAYVLDHRFDLLGSGRIQVRHEMKCPGLAGHFYPASAGVEADRAGNWLSECVSTPNLPFSKRIWHLIDGPYVPIDWHLDFKSGFRWSETTWYKHIRYGTTPGADVKVPWELSRMQHLPQLALSAVFSNKGALGFDAPEIYAREFRNQLLDFVATNPPRFGVNWKCTMDVAIRAANLLVAYDIFLSANVSFDNEFEKLFHCSIYDHGRHIIRNLEWTEELASNHYTANIAGLLFVAAYLPRSSETDTWLALAVQELHKIVAGQFLPDGAHFEASTAYHCLCTEMVIYATALVLGLPSDKMSALREYDHQVHCGRPRLRPAPLSMYPINEGKRHIPLPKSFVMHLGRIAAFIGDIIRPDGTLPQIGDNDSGRFLNLEPNFVRTNTRGAQFRYLNLSHLGDVSETLDYHLPIDPDPAFLVRAVKTLLIGLDSDCCPGKRSIGEQLVTALAAGNSLRKKEPFDIEVGRSTVAISPDKGRHTDSRRLSPQLPEIDEAAFRISKKSYMLRPFPEFGLYIFRSNRVYLSMRCGYSKAGPIPGHAHNDQFSFELAVDEKPFIVDPGTFIYTPLPEMRNRFRSALMHNTLGFRSLEQNVMRGGFAGLFHMSNRSRAVVEQITNDLFVGKHYGFGKPVVRSVELEQKRIIGTDVCERQEEKIISFHLAPGIEIKFLEKRLPIVLVHETTQVQIEGGPGIWSVEDDFYSPGYGVIVRSKSLKLHSQADQIQWEISWD